VTPRQILQRLGNTFDHFHRAFEDPFRERHHPIQVAIANLALAQAPVAFAEIAAEILRAVPVDLRIDDLDLVERLADLLRRHGRVRQEFGELFERALEVNVVFPKGVVGIDDQVLSHFFARGRRRNGISITTSTSTGTPSRRAGSNSHFRSAATALVSSLASTPRRMVMPYT